MLTHPRGTTSPASEMVYETLCTAYLALLPAGLAESRPSYGAAPGRVDLGADAGPLGATEFADLAGSARWGEFVDALGRVGSCEHPIKVVGTAHRINAATGEVLSSYSSRQEPGGVTYLPCGNRRAAWCLPCSRRYAGDVYQLIRAGIAGGKTVPAQVAENPLVFVTLTAPSFGKVHTRTHTGACHPGRQGWTPTLCPHGRPRTCTARHSGEDPLLGQALCGDCYDYASQVIWHYWVPKLWGRFTVALRRAVAHEFGVSATRVHEVATVQFVKVAEDQERAAVHYHALIRLDGPRSSTGYAPAPAQIDAARLAELIHRAAAHVRLTVPGVDLEDPERILCFGAQIDTRAVRAAHRDDDPDSELTAGQVGGYLAKYVTKSTGDDPARANNPHQTRLRAAVRRLAGRAAANPDPVLRESYRQLRRRTEDNGYRGHRTSKSRRFSVTLGQLRRARRRAARLLAQAGREHRRIDLAALEQQLLAEDDSATEIVLGTWSYAGQGWNTNAEQTLARACAAMAREYQRQAAVEHRTVGRRG